MGEELTGRLGELAWLDGRAAARRVLVAGAPGMGKTALVRQYARGGAAAPAWVDVIRGAGVEDLTRAIATACGVGPAPTAEASMRQLVRSSERAVVVLDGAEVAAAGVAELLPALAERVPSLRVVATSRVRLPGFDDTLALGPLAVPPGGADASAIWASPAADLFARRAGLAEAVRSPDVAAKVATIVRAVEGIPLSIVVVAASMRVLDLATLEELVVGHELPSLELAEALAASLEALPASALELLLHLALFRGPFSARRALAIAATGRVGGSSAAVLDLETLVDHSMIERAFDGGLDDARFRVLGPVRDAVAARLGGGDAERSAKRAFVELALSERGRATDADLSELGHAVELAVELGDARAAAELALAASAHFLTRGPFARYGAMLTRVLDAAAGLPATTLAELHLARARARVLVGDHAAEASDLERAVAIGDATVRAQALAKLAFASARKGDLERAMAATRDAEEALAAAAEPPSARVLGLVLKDLANVHAEAGSDVAYDYLLRALACFERAGDLREVAFVELMLASRYCDAGRVDLGRAHAERALAGFRAVGDARSPSWAHTLLGIACQEERAFAEARRHLEQARACAVGVGDVHTEALVLGYDGALALEAGRSRDAMELAARGSVALEELGDAGAAAYFAGVLAVALAEQGHDDAATSALDRARRLLPAKGREARAVALGLFDAAAGIARGGAPPPPTPTRDPASRFEEVRFASRLVDRLLARAASAGGRAALTVGPKAAWVEGDGGRVDLEAHPLLRTIFEALLERREASPGAALSLAELQGLAWPNEKILPRAAKNRLYVAIARLRDKGLGEALQRARDGYRLDPALAIVRAPTSG